MSFINNLAYEASAGSGKTFMLVVRYLSLLFFLVPIVSDGNAYMSLYGCNMHSNAGALEREKEHKLD